ENLGDAGLLLQLAADGLFEGFLDADEAAGQRPPALEGLQVAADEEDLEVLLVQAEDDGVHGQRRPGVFVGGGHAVSLVSSLHYYSCRDNTKSRAWAPLTGSFSEGLVRPASRYATPGRTRPPPRRTRPPSRTWPGGRRRGSASFPPAAG